MVTGGGLVDRFSGMARRLSGTRWRWWHRAVRVVGAAELYATDGSCVLYEFASVRKLKSKEGDPGGSEAMRTDRGRLSGPRCPLSAAQAPPGRDRLPMKHEP